MPRQRFVVAGEEGPPDGGSPSADGMLPTKKADMTITAMSAFLFLLSAGISRRSPLTGIRICPSRRWAGRTCRLFSAFHTGTRCLACAV